MKTPIESLGSHEIYSNDLLSITVNMQLSILILQSSGDNKQAFLVRGLKK